MKSEKLVAGVFVLAVVAVGFGATALLLRRSHAPEGAPPAPPVSGAAATPVAGDKPILQFFKNPTPLAAVVIKDLDGRTISSDSWRGKVTIVNVWATWCPPCRAEIPDLIALQNKYRGQLQVIGLSQDETGPETVRRFVNEQHMNYPVGMFTPEMTRVFSGVYALPTSFIIDRDLRIVQKHVGMLNAATTELEARSLAGLDTNASIEYIGSEDDAKTAMIKNAAQATNIPGVDLSTLSPSARGTVLKRLNTEMCTCGCGLTLAACRINDPSCSISLPIARKIADEARATD